MRAHLSFCSVWAAVFGSLCGSGAWAQTSLGSAFSYQGRLTQAGRPFDGEARMTFVLWNHPTQGTPGQLMGIQHIENVPVANGLFTVELNGNGELMNFGNVPIFVGYEHWIEVTVEIPPGSGNSVLLAPRQRLTPAPNALYSKSTSWSGLQDVPPGFADGVDNGAGDGHSLDASDGSPSDALFVDASGAVGIGTTAPLSNLDIASLGPAILRLNADTDNANEADIASVFFRQDGGQVAGRVGFRSDNNFEVVNAYDASLWLGVNNGAQVEIHSGGMRVFGAMGAEAVDIDGRFRWNTVSVDELRLENAGVTGWEFNHSGLEPQVYYNGALHLIDNDGGEGSVYMAVGEDVLLGDTGVLYSDTIYSAGKFFRLDHPLDPANQFLLHSCVESNEQKNVYDGVVTTDADGEATVTLPDYFQALNGDFRYQLTVIGQFAQAIVAREIENNSFTIRTDRPDVKVSWQVTGVRHDAFARAMRFQPQQEKRGLERGRYLHPKLFGQPKELAIGMIRQVQRDRVQSEPERK